MQELTEVKSAKNNISHQYRKELNELHQYGIKVSTETKPCKINRALDKLEVLKALEKSRENLFEPDSRKYKIFE